MTDNPLKEVCPPYAAELCFSTTGGRLLPNPFTPSRVANKPQEFFGRQDQIAEVPRVIRQGSIVIDGPTGIGKSSLLSQIMLAIESPVVGNGPLGVIYPMICSRSLKTPEDVALRLLAEIMTPISKSTSKKFFIPKFFEYQVTTTNTSPDGAHALKKIREFLIGVVKQTEHLAVVAFDEADKCASAIAQFVRIILTATELDQSGLDRIRFVVAGVSPFYNEMIANDEGIARFVYERYSLPPFDQDEAVEFLEEKIQTVLRSPEGRQVNLHCSDDLYPLVARVTGGHPHLLQLVGSYIIDHEDGDPDNLLDYHDLVGCFQRICFQNRGPVYEKILHEIACDGHLESLKTLLSCADSHCPTHISRSKASTVVEDETCQYLLKKGILSFDSGWNRYRLNDEFLRIRIILDNPDTNPKELEKKLLRFQQSDPRYGSGSEFAYGIDTRYGGDLNDEEDEDFFRTDEDEDEDEDDQEDDVEADEDDEDDDEDDGDDEIEGKTHTSR